MTEWKGKRNAGFEFYTNLKMESMALISSQNLILLFFNIFQLVHTLSSIYDTLAFFSSLAYTFQEEEVEDLVGQ